MLCHFLQNLEEIDGRKEIAPRINADNFDFAITIFASASIWLRRTEHGVLWPTRGF